MEEIVEVPKTMYAKLNDLESYQILNEEISTAKGYPNNGTSIYSEPEPQSLNGLYFMQITPEVQEVYPETLIGITLIENLPQNEEDIII